MKLLILFVSLAFVTGSWYFLNRAWHRQKRRKLLATPFPDAWEEILLRNLPPYAKLTDDLRQQLRDYIRIFIGEKSFEGCGGLTLTDEIKVTIAAQACMLLLNRRTECYPKLFSILVYPSTYVARNRDNPGTLPEESSIRLGESWSTGAVVLAWDSVKGGAVNFHDGHNVTLHEFAHQLDQIDGSSDGVPVMANRSAYSAWARVFSKEYRELQEKTAHGRKSLLDAYGATNPAEFFAVATEIFFEKPGQLKRRHPELYAELAGFYRVNPIDWE